MTPPSKCCRCSGVPMKDRNTLVNTDERTMALEFQSSLWFHLSFQNQIDVATIQGTSTVGHPTFFNAMAVNFSPKSKKSIITCFQFPSNKYLTRRTNRAPILVGVRIRNSSAQKKSKKLSKERTKDPTDLSQTNTGQHS